MCIVGWSWNHFLRWYSAVPCSLLEISVYFRHSRLTESSLGRETQEVWVLFQLLQLTWHTTLSKITFFPHASVFSSVKWTKWHTLGKSILWFNVKKYYKSTWSLFLRDIYHQVRNFLNTFLNSQCSARGTSQGKISSRENKLLNFDHSVQLNIYFWMRIPKIYLKPSLDKGPLKDYYIFVLCVHTPLSTVLALYKHS